MPELPDLRQLSFSSRWIGEATAVTLVTGTGIRAFTFAYIRDAGEDQICRVVAAIENNEEFSLEPRSTLWRVSEIHVERQDGWLIFSRIQGDISLAAQRDFFVDSKNFLEYLRDEDVRIYHKTNSPLIK